MIQPYRGYTLAEYGVTPEQRHVSIYHGMQKIDEAADFDAAKAIIDGWQDAK